MRKDMLNKAFVLGVVFLFIIVVFQPAFANNINIFNENQQFGNKLPITTNPIFQNNVTFKKSFGGTRNDYGKYVQQTSDGGYIITGETRSFGVGASDVWLIKTDVNGNKTWDKTFGGIEFETGYYVQQTNDGGYIIIGRVSSFGAGKYDVWLVKTDYTGNEEWNKTFGGTGYEEGYSGQQTTDGGYIITGVKGTGYDSDVWLIKTDSFGNKKWDKTFGEAYRGNCVQQTTDGGYIITGGTRIEAILIKTNSTGNKMWDKTYHADFKDEGLFVQQTTDGGYIITGSTQMFGSYPDLLLLKTDSSGNQLWYETLYGEDPGYCVRQTSDGGYITTGGDYEVALVKTTGAGTEMWARGFGGDVGFCVQQTMDGGYIITGDMDGDVCLIKTDKDGNVRNKAINKPILNWLQSHPNLFPILQKLLLLIK